MEIPPSLTFHFTGYRGNTSTYDGLLVQFLIKLMKGTRETHTATVIRGNVGHVTEKDFT